MQNIFIYSENYTDKMKRARIIMQINTCFLCCAVVNCFQTEKQGAFSNKAP